MGIVCREAAFAAHAPDSCAYNPFLFQQGRRLFLCSRFGSRLGTSAEHLRSRALRSEPLLPSSTRGTPPLGFTRSGGNTPTPSAQQALGCLDRGNDRVWGASLLYIAAQSML